MVVTREYVEIRVEPARCGPSSPRRARAGRTRRRLLLGHLPAHRADAALGVRLAGYGFVVAVPEIYHRIEPAGTVLGFDDEGKVRGQADADATPVADFDADIDAALGWLAEYSSGVARRGRALHRRPPRVPRGARPQVRATACWYATGLHDGKLGDGRRRGLARPRRGDPGRAADDLGHARPAHAGGGARADRRAPGGGGRD